MKSEQPLRRWLFVIHTPWSRDLGAPRVQLELGEELELQGCTWSKFSREDAFPSRRPRGRLSRWLFGMVDQNRSFSTRAQAFVRENAHQFDVIEAHQTDLPVTKRQLGFQGLLVARSVGFLPAYEEFERFAAQRWPRPRSLRGNVERLLTEPLRRRQRRDLRPSLAAADLINVANRDEHDTLAKGWGYGNRVVRFPIGISRHRLIELAGDRDRTASSPDHVVAFVGTWNERKGAGDWPSLVAKILALLPGTRFRFLGTSIPEERVLAGFGDHRRAIEVIPSFRSEELPGLLRVARVAAFPGYLEGFGISVLETLAAGLPTVVYDAPGPRDIVAELSRPRLVPRGDVDAMASEVVSALLSDDPEWSAESAQAIEAAATFDNAKIALRTRDIYTQHWKQLRTA